MELKKYFENPHSFNVNTCGHGMPLKPYASVQEALAQEGQFSKQVTPLSKNWAYFTFDGMQDIPHELFSSQTPLANTQIVSFPYSVENQDEAFPFLIDPPYVPANNPVQVFAKNLTLNRADDGQQRFLSIEGIYNSCYVYLNGQLVGYSGQPGQSVQFDCTPHFQTGPNRLVLIVVAHSAASYLVPYVHFGIVSKVHLITRQAGGVRDLSLSYDLPCDYNTVTLTVEVDAQCHEEVTLALYSPAGELVCSLPCSAEGQGVLTVDRPVLWSHETPNLYTLTATFKEETVCRKVGFRNCVISEKGITVNGRRVPLQGLFYSPAMVPLSKLKEDLGSMKAHHVNAVAITEFPTADFLNLCDQYGLYVLAHSGIHTPYLQNCPHNFVANNPLFRELLLDRMEGFVAQTVHPCVVARCVGSNVGEGSNIKFALETLQQLDPACFAYCEDTFPLEVGSVAGEWTALTPTLEELKQAFCPIGAELTDGAAGEVTLTNKNAFTYFSKFECEYEVSRYGKVVERGHGGIFSLPPTVTQTVQLPYHLPSEGECALRLIFKYFGDTPYAKSGEVAGQFSFLLPVSAKRVNTPVNLPLPELREQENQWHIYAGGCHYTFSTLLGDFTQMDYHNHPIFAQELCQGEWLLRCKETEYSVEENCIIVTASYRVGKQGFPPAGELIRRFTFYGDGCVTVEQGADPQSLYLPILWQVSERFQTLHYYGFGPAGTPREELGTSYMGHFSLDVENQSLDNAQGKLFRLTTKGGFGLAVWNNKQSLNFSAHCKEDKNQIFLAMTPSFTIKLVDEGEDVWQYYNNTYQPIN